MRSKKILLDGCRLYLILDRQVNTYKELFEITQKALAAGVDIIQLRDKTGSARDILAFSRRVLALTKKKIPYIINDRVDLAVIAGASGVHLGQEDVPLAEARTVMGPKACIGISCQTPAHARKAQRDGADYIGFGSVFKTQTKPDRSPMALQLLRRVATQIKIPVFAIGGIRLKDVPRLMDLGVSRVAVCRAVCRSNDVSQAVKRFRTVIYNKGRL